MFYNIVTYGCQMNVHESEKIAGILEKLGYSPTTKREDADIIVFNTCAIREGAEDRAFGNIGALKKMKKANPNKIIVVCGCMSQQKQVADKIYKTFPFVDIILGTHNLHKLEQLITQKLQTKKRLLDHMESSEVYEGLPCTRTSGKNAWVNIMYGCNNFCTYCIVPYVRGREKSRNKQDILNEIKTIIESKQYETITLLGQNVNSYGNDSPENGNFACLLQDICNLDGDFKLTFMTSHPKDLTKEVIDTIANNEKIIKEIHLPVQSGSNRILKLMNRKYTREHYIEIIDYIKSKIPNVRLTSDFIVGFPTETEQDFEDTLKLVEYVKYDSIFAFMYSKRSGTVAEKMEGQIDEEIKNIRVNKLLNFVKEINEK
ncbi:MAG: tRNA (N6-isopentenyl adenosine(37)-C2)-methylthiotransferase MiaB, partial [Clostridia bacterium]|nr:tRNA (N6-isopentenyl adenosine(37)-C2)-methylthiotransferase MiaB [Clostridia bacterium]